jgi:Tfp pilus assembly protein PilN
LVGLGITSIGSYYENKANSTKELQANLKSEKEKIQKELQELKSEIAGMSNPLEKEINNLTRNKNEIIKMQAINSTENHQFYNKIMKDIAIKAKSAGVLLTNIKYNDNGLMLMGTVEKEETFTNFLNNLQQAETLKGKSLNLISLQKNENNFEFKVASENI